MPNDESLIQASTPRRRRRWPTYGVVVLLALAALWVWLGVLVYRARSQRLAVETVAKLGGKAYYAYQVDKKRHIYYLDADVPSPHPAWMKHLLGEDVFAHVTVVDLQRRTDISDADLAVLRHFPTLRFLDLTSVRTISDEGLAHLRSLDQLERVLLSSPKVTSAALAHFRDLLQLEVLWLVNAQIRDEDLSQLLHLPRLAVLVVSAEKISQEAAEAFMSERFRCEVVRLPTLRRGSFKRPPKR